MLATVLDDARALRCHKVQVVSHKRHRDDGDGPNLGDGVHWHEVPKTPWAPRHAASVFVHDNALWTVAGNNMQSDVWKLVRKK